jgi:predicted DNA-binding protein
MEISILLAELQEEFRLSGNENQETRSAKQKTLDKLSIDNKKCKSYLIQRIDDAHLEYIKGKACAHDVWKALQAVFQKKGNANKKAITTDEV